MKKFKRLTLFAATLLSLFSLTPSLALAADAKGAIQCGVNGAAGVDNCQAQPTDSLDVTIRRIVNILSVLIGVVAVIMIMVGGFRYITSAGNSEGAKSARQTVLYAVIGLIIVALSQVIARFVLTNV